MGSRGTDEDEDGAGEEEEAGGAEEGRGGEDEEGRGGEDEEGEGEKEEEVASRSSAIIDGVAIKDVEGEYTENRIMDHDDDMALVTTGYFA